MATAVSASRTPRLAAEVSPLSRHHLPCSDSGFRSIESGAMKGVVHGECSGRRPLEVSAVRSLI